MKYLRNMFGGLINLSTIVTLLACISVTCLNQYVTHQNSQVWLAGREHNRRQAEMNAQVLQMETSFAYTVQFLKGVMSQADSQRVRAEKLEYERDRVIDRLAELKGFQDSLARYARYLQGVCEGSGTEFESFEQFCKKPVDN